LGWRSEREDNVFVPYPLEKRVAFALWSLESAAPNVAAVVAAGGGFAGTLLCVVVDSAEEVEMALQGVSDAGGRVVVEDHEQPFGRSGWFVDPVGTTWEVAWIDGQDSAVPFAGAAQPDAVPLSLAGVTLWSDEPAGLQEFYAEGLGWGEHRGEFGGRPALSVQGGFLAFGPPPADARFGGPTPVFVVRSPAQLETVVDDLSRLGTTVLRPPGGPAGALVVDPFGMAWEVVEDTGLTL
jgi:uncharacterized glyoxalase superfamily protein PhnB